MKRKSKMQPGDDRLQLIRFIAMLAFLFLVCAVCFLGAVVIFLLSNPSIITLPLPPIEESIEIPLNSHGPVYTQNEYSNWVSISISGSAEQNGEFFHDAFYQYDEQRGSQNRFRGFLIDGVYALDSRASGSNYRDDHIYRFSHSVYRFPRSTDAHSPKAIGFQVINEAARGLDGVFIVEISSDSFKHKPEARGR